MNKPLKYQYTKPEAKSLITPKVDNLVREILIQNKVLYHYQRKWRNNIAAAIRDQRLTFKRMPTKSGTATVYISSSLGVVVKVGGTSDMEGSRYISKIRKGVPTVVLFDRIDGENELIRIQPIVDISAKAVKQAHAELSELSCVSVGDDCHSGNVGVYKGKSVVFDW